MNRCERSNKPFRLRITRLEDHPAELELAAERRERLGRAATRGDRRLTVPDQLLRQHPQPPEVPRETPEDVRRLLAEDQRRRRSPATSRPRRSRPSRDVADRDRPAPARSAPTDRTGPARPADTQSAETSAPPRTAAGPRARSRRRSTSRPHSRAPPPSPATAATESVGSAASCSQIQSLNGSSFDPAGLRSYLGGTGAANNLATVLRCNPVRRLISRADNPSTRRIRRTSAHCSTPTNPSSSPIATDQTRVKGQPDNTDPTPKWPTFQPAQVA